VVVALPLLLLLLLSGNSFAALPLLMLHRQLNKH
jgi:hypothetical protein